MTVPTRSAVKRPLGFQPRPAARLVHPPEVASDVPMWRLGHRGRQRNRTARVETRSEEGERLERYGVTRASASNGARRPVRFTFRMAASGDRRTNRYARTARS